jgi:DNA-directed RNA polymerase specialized sigma24 family protein
MAKSFEKTRWTLVLRAGDKSDVSAAKKALGELCALYWEPVYQLIRRYRPSVSKDDARDLTQGFFASLLERGGVASADRERGRFRSWMFGAVRHYLWNASATANAEKRKVDAISLDSDDAAGQGARNLHAHEVSPGCRTHSLRRHIRPAFCGSASWCWAPEESNPTILRSPKILVRT